MMAAAQPRLMTHIFALCNLVMWMDSLADLTLSLNGSRWSVAQGVVGRWGGGAEGRDLLEAKNLMLWPRPVNAGSLIYPAFTY
jgi:hypothetical protein